MGHAASSEPASTAKLRLLYRFMACRDFIAGRQELLGGGFGLPQIKNWLRSGRLVAIFRGVYAYGRDVDTPRAALRGGLIAVGPGSALTGRSACEAFGFVRSANEFPRQIHVATPSGQSRLIRGSSPALRATVVRAMFRAVSDRDVCSVGGIEVVRPVLALVDFAMDAGAREVRFAFLEACRLRQFQRNDLSECSRELAGRRGMGKLRPLLSLWVPELERTRSAFEGAVLLEISNRGIPMPEVNVKVNGYEVDCFWRQQRVVLELDGKAFHNDPVRKQLDAHKQEEIEAEGILVLRITFAEFDADPDTSLDRIKQALDRP